MLNNDFFEKDGFDDGFNNFIFDKVVFSYLDELSSSNDEDRKVECYNNIENTIVAHIGKYELNDEICSKFEKIGYIPNLKGLYVQDCKGWTKL